MKRINDQLTTTLSEFKDNPEDLVRQADEEPLLVLADDKPVFYVLAPEIYECLLEALDDADIAIQLMVEKRIEV